MRLTLRELNRVQEIQARDMLARPEIDAEYSPTELEIAYRVRAEIMTERNRSDNQQPRKELCEYE